MKEAKHLGVDMFLLDDGWFANKYPRQNDKPDWAIGRLHTISCQTAIPHLVQVAKDAGVKFGIWIEPEMVNPKSELSRNTRTGRSIYRIVRPITIAINLS